MTTQEANECIAELKAALADMLSGWQYIRQQHGDLSGVGWDRAEAKAIAALTLERELSES